ncbi:hypothetical protein [Acetivibrio straminisolvens]|uniref:Uncharacterized protein n=1 Tax=Acetivibrio straminisolvens JCM 21531 TaxID=1294263 RepID=W4V3U3_9FIRM|nr:hypothetical protein [Acetivibrio straminisolvens]GAE87866.1 hypothetical protein JCM21531_1270 [Acetivibrio straminisolvens JCM 21531]
MDKKRILPYKSEEVSGENINSDANKEYGSIQDTESKSPLAYGLPSWSIEPPGIAIRRKVRIL